MSAYSFVHHRMFVAALSPAAGTSLRPTGPDVVGAVRAATPPKTDSHRHSGIPAAAVAGGLLANAMLRGLQPNPS